MDARQKKRRIAIVIAVAAAISVVAVPLIAGLSDDDDNGGGGSDVNSGDVTSVVYQFNDASVAPEFHRSYSIIVTEGQARVEVYSYEETLHDVSEPIDAALWQRTVDAAVGFADEKSVENNGCSGGTSERLTVLGQSDQELFEVFIDNCEGGGANISAAVSDVRALFDMDMLLATD